MIDQIGLAPTLMRLNDQFLISLGGMNSSSINIFDTLNTTWTHVGKSDSIRNGAFALFNNFEGTVLICGGMNEDCDNSLEIESFPIGYDEIAVTSLSNSFYPCQIQQITLENSFLLRKIHPMVLAVPDNIFLICGGKNIFNTSTKTCAVFDLIENKISFTHTKSISSLENKNPNSILYKNFIYFFNSDDEVQRYSINDCSFEFVAKNMIDPSTTASV